MKLAYSPDYSPVHYYFKLSFKTKCLFLVKVHLIVRCDWYCICFFLLYYAIFGCCDQYSEGTHSPKNTVHCFLHITKAFPRSSHLSVVFIQLLLRCWHLEMLICGSQLTTSGSEIQGQREVPKTAVSLVAPFLGPSIPTGSARSLLGFNFVYITHPSGYWSWCLLGLTSPPCIWCCCLLEHFLMQSFEN